MIVVIDRVVSAAQEEAASKIEARDEQSEAGLALVLFCPLAAAALQGLIYGVVKAAIDRAGAQGYKAVTHETPE